MRLVEDDGPLVGAEAVAGRLDGEDGADGRNVAAEIARDGSHVLSAQRTRRADAVGEVAK